MVKLLFSTTGIHGNNKLSDAEAYISSPVCLLPQIKQWIMNAVEKYKDGKCSRTCFI